MSDNVSLDQPITKTKAIIFYCLTALFLIFEIAIQVSPGVMTKGLMNSLNINVFWLGIMSSSYFITYAAMQIPAGILYDKFKLKYVISFPLLLCVIGCAIFALSTNIYVSIIARIIMGFGSAFAFIGVLMIASLVFNKKHFPFFAGITQFIVATGAITGTIVIAAIVQQLGWRYTMLIFSGCGLIIFFSIFMLMNLNTTHHHKSTDTFSKLINICKLPINWYIASYACLLWMPMVVIGSLYGVPFIQAHFKVNYLFASTCITFLWLGLAAGSPIFGYLMGKTNLVKFWLVICSTLGLIAYSIILILPYNISILLIVLFFLCGSACAGQGLSFVLIKQINSKDSQATAIGFNNTALVLSGTLFQPIVGYIIQYSGVNYYNGMLFIISGYLLSLLIALFKIHDVT